eukprot:m.155606 g.155606  ORF g.155606 m.155606 type:complete len:55 (-) comp16281_c0_seq4:2468-2632(-)
MDTTNKDPLTKRQNKSKQEQTGNHFQDLVTNKRNWSMVTVPSDVGSPSLCVNIA